MDGKIFSKNELTEKIGVISAAVISGAKDDIFRAALFRVGNGSVSVLANNYGVFVRAGDEIVDDGKNGVFSAIVPYKTLSDAVKTIGGENISVRKTKRSLILESGKEKFQIKEVDGEIDESVPVDVFFGSFVVDAEIWRKAIERVSFAAGKDDLRPALTGINVRVVGDRAIVEAADGVFLSRTEISVRDVIKTDRVSNIKFLYPAITAAKFAKLGKSGDLTVAIYSGRVTFLGDGFEASTSTIEVGFPELDQVIPRKNSLSVSVDRKRLSLAIKRAELFSGEHGFGNVIIENGAVSIEAFAVDVGSTSEIIGGEVSDIEKKFAIRFDLHRLKKLAESAGDKVVFRFSENTDPAVVSADGDSDWVGVIMPVYIDRDS